MKGFGKTIENTDFAEKLLKVGNSLRENFRMVNLKVRVLMFDKMKHMKEIG